MKNKILKKLRLLALGTAIIGINFVDQGGMCSVCGKDHSPEMLCGMLSASTAKDLFDSLNVIWGNGGELPNIFKVCSTVDDESMQILGYLIAESKSLSKLILDTQGTVMSTQGMAYFARGIVENYLNSGTLRELIIDTPLREDQLKSIEILTVAGWLNQNCDIYISPEKYYFVKAKTPIDVVGGGLRLGLITECNMSERNLSLLLQSLGLYFETYHYNPSNQLLAH